MAGKILLAEDDGNLRETLSDLMRTEGWDVVAVQNGQAALDALAEDGAGFHAVVLDGLLPKVNGFEIARQLRHAKNDIPIVMMSGVYKSNDQQRDAKDRFDVRAYLVKPFENKRLLDVLRPLIKERDSDARPDNPLPASGNLLENPPYYLLWRAAQEGHTGILELTSDGEQGRIFLFRGRAVLAQHSDPMLNVGVELVRRGMMNADTYKEAAQLAGKRCIGIADVVKQQGWANDAEVSSAYKSLIPKIIGKLVASSGTFKWTGTDAFHGLVPEAPIPILEALNAGLRKTTTTQLEKHVTPRRPLRLAPGTNWTESCAQLLPACGSDTLVRAINGRATIAQLMEAAPNEAERASRHRQIYLLMSTMAVQASLEAFKAAIDDAPAPAPSPLIDELFSSAPVRTPMQRAASQPSMAASTVSPSAGPASNASTPPARAQAGKPVIDTSVDASIRFTADEEAARARIDAKFQEIEGKDYYDLLGLKRGSDMAALKKQYFALAKDFHTDAYAGLKLGSAQKKLDHVFSAIQTAYSTLSNDKARAEYDAKLSFQAQGATTDIAAIMQAEADFQKVQLLIGRGEIAGALKIVEKLLPLMPKNEELVGTQKYCAWYQSKSPITAPNICKELENLWKAVPGALSLKEYQGWIYMEISDYKNAKAAFKRVLDSEPKHPGATRGLRSVQRKQEEDEKKNSGLGRFLKR